MTEILRHKALRTRVAEIDVPADDPFTNDALRRRDSAQVLTQFVSRIQEPFVLAIDAPWGSGKTTFVQMWHQQLKNEGFPALYFNAWETDFSDDPFVSLVGELSAAVENMIGSEDKASTQLKRAKKVAVALAKRSVPVAIRIATAGVLDVNDVIEKEVSKLAGDIAQEQIDSYSASKESISEFRAALEKVVELLDPDSGRPLIFFIDELDRCRPTYAIELLERAKHLFSVPGVIFVLSLDKRQLAHSIKTVYGANFDASGYLRRFIDMDYVLPEPEPGNYARHLVARMNFAEYFERRTSKLRQQELATTADLLSELFALVSFSLREQIQCISRLWIVLNTIPDNHKLYEHELVIMTVLREWKPDEFSSFSRGGLAHWQAVDLFRKLPGGESYFGTNKGRVVEAILSLGSDEINGSNDAMVSYETQATADSKKGVDPSHAAEVLDLMRHIKSHEREGSMAATLKRLSLGQNFIVREFETPTN